MKLLEEYIESLRQCDNQLTQILSTRKSLENSFEVAFSNTFIFDRECKCLFANNLGAQHLGYNSKDIEGKHWSELNLPKNVMERVQGNLTDVFKTGASSKFMEQAFPTIYGERFYQCSLTPYFSGDKVVAVICSIVDVTENRKVLLSYKNESNKLQRLIDSSPIGIYIVNNQGIILAANTTFFERISPFEKKEVIGNSYRALTDALQLKLEETSVYKALLHKVVSQSSFSIGDKSYLTTATPYLFHETELVEGVIVYVWDSTEYEMNRQENLRLQRLSLVSEMAAGVAHEIRNPMTVIKGYLQLFKRREKSKVKIEQYGLVLSELGRVEGIITDFLSLARNKVNNICLKNINDIVQHLEPLISADATKNNVELKLELANNLPEVSVDEGEITQVILNLSRNGIEATEGKGTLAICTRWEVNEVVLTIEDTGCGIPTNMQNRIFDPFYTTKESGTGLGLSVCRSILDRHNAVIRVESFEGMGTKFIISFPIAKSV